MNASRYPWIWISLFVLAIALALAGCEPAATQTPTPAVYIGEREATCPITNFWDDNSITVKDPELGSSDRAFFISWEFGCDEPYLKGKSFGLQDGYFVGGDYHWTGQYEIVTDEGGVWTGIGYNKSENEQRSAYGTYQGSGKYTGLQMAFESTGDKVKIKVTNAPLEETPPATGTETVILEKEITCASKPSLGKHGYTNPDVPDLANVEWGRLMTYLYTCDEPYLKGKQVSFANIQTGEDPSDVIMYSELVTDEDGAWVGPCEGSMTKDGRWPEKGKCTFQGASLYTGLVMTMEWEGDTIKLRIVQPEEGSVETGG